MLAETFMINQLTIKSKKYDEIRKITTRKGDDYTTECLLDYQYFKDHYQLMAVDLSKQKELNADPLSYSTNRILWNVKD